MTNDSNQDLYDMVDDLIDEKLLDFVESRLSEEQIFQAFDEFSLGFEYADDEFNPISNFIFIPWHLFQHTSKTNKSPIAMTYLEKNRKKLTADKQQIIEAACQSYFSFYEVIEIELGQQAKLKDLLLQTEHDVLLATDIESLKTQDIIYASLLSHNNQTAFLSVGPYIVPGECRLDFIELGKGLVEENNNKPLTTKELRGEYANDIRNVYFEYIDDDDELDKTMREILKEMNPEERDQYLVEFKLNTDPLTAVKSLLPLTVDMTEEEILTDAEYDNTGRLVHAQFSWMELLQNEPNEADYEVAGIVAIELDKLSIFIDSEDHVILAKQRIQELLNDQAIFQKTDILPFKDLAKALEKEFTNNGG